MSNPESIIVHQGTMIDSLGQMLRDWGLPQMSTTDLALVISILAYFLMTVVVLKRRGSPAVSTGFDRMAGLLGKLEKLETIVNDLRTSVTRSNDLIQADLRFLRDDLSALRNLLDVRAAPTLPEPAAQPAQSRTGSSAEELARNPTLTDVPRPTGTFKAPDGSGGPPPRPIEPPSAPGVVEQPELAKEAREKPRLQEVPETLTRRLTKTRLGLFEKVRQLFGAKPQLDPAALDEIEATLLGADLGVKTVSALMDEVKGELQRGQAVDEEGFKALLKMRVLSILEKDAPLDSIRPMARKGGPLVVLVVGVNGVGKTTTVAKLAKLWKEQGAKVLVVAADTFRAAATEQLTYWAEDIGVPIVMADQPNTKPATVVYDGVEQGCAQGFDVVLIDTAGRLHNKANLMSELEGVRNSIKRHLEDAPHEVLLVIDGSTGQNALAQAKEFHQAVQLSGLVVTKLDGTPRGGIVVAIKQELGIPIRYIGVGESAHDLRSFQPRDFVEALFDSEGLGPSASGSFQGLARRRRRDTM